MGMGAFWPHDRFLTRALLASLALHLLFAFFIPSLASVSGSGPTIETISFVRMVRMSIQHLQPKAQPQAAVAPKHATTVSITHARTVNGSHANSVQPQTRPDAAPNVGAQSQLNANAQGVAPNSTPAQAQTQVAASNQTRQQTGGNMPFGAEEQNPVLEPDVHKALDALGVHVTLIITVDDTGHTKSITFQPPLSNDVEDRIRAMLASATWDPAICGAGVSCEGKATIKL
jgi:hypothetical protein